MTGLFNRRVVSILHLLLNLANHVIIGSLLIIDPVKYSFVYWIAWIMSDSSCFSTFFDQLSWLMVVFISEVAAFVTSLIISIIRYASCVCSFFIFSLILKFIFWSRSSLKISQSLNLLVRYCFFCFCILTASCTGTWLKINNSNF